MSLEYLIQFGVPCAYALACRVQSLIYHHGSCLHWKLTMLVNRLIIAPNVLVFV